MTGTSTAGMLLRGTSKALKLLRPDQLVIARAGADDWYANLLWLDRRKCLLLAHAGTLFPIFAADLRAAQLRPLGPWLTELITKHLARKASRRKRSALSRPTISGSRRPPAATCSAS